MISFASDLLLELLSISTIFPSFALIFWLDVTISIFFLPPIPPSGMLIGTFTPPISFDDMRVVVTVAHYLYGQRQRNLPELLGHQSHVQHYPLVRLDHALFMVQTVFC